jgi:hypothetical protein
MKLVRENINEKFTEDSDPIKDLGIGMPKAGSIIFNKSKVYFTVSDNFYTVIDKEANVYMSSENNWDVLDIKHYKKYFILTLRTGGSYPIDVILTYDQFYKYFEVIQK